MKNLFVLPFDHRANFAQKLLGFPENPSPEEKEIVTNYKKIIYDAIWLAIEKGIPKEETAVLVDEVYGAEILKDAKEKGLVTMQTVEKSGKDEFEFEYGEEFGEHLLTIMPAYAKALVRYDIQKDNSAQLSRLKRLSDFCITNDIKLLIEPLMHLKGDQSDFDHNQRYKDLILMIKEMQVAGIEPDIWKIEGLYEKYQYEEVVRQARNIRAREQVGIIVLGRNETKEHVIKWIEAGRDVEGVVGFAVGRTIFWHPLMQYKEGRISREEAVALIAEDYIGYWKVFSKQV